jgi:trimeric autotransporter adhesin
MKKYLVLSVLILLSFLKVNAQIKVYSGGNVCAGSTSSTPNKPLVIAKSGGIRILRTANADSTNELVFQDNGQIRSGTDYNHRIIFDRTNNILELREYGDLCFSPGSTSGTRTQKVTFTSGGNVGLGLSSPSLQLQLSTNSAGKPSTSTWTVVSDSRTKTNVEPYRNGLDLVKQVHLVSFQYNGVANTPVGEVGIGVIAQDFQTIFPRSVKPYISKPDSAGAEVTYYGVDFHELFIANVIAVQQLDSIISGLDSIVNLQNEKIDELQNQLLSCCSQEGRMSSNTLINAQNINQNGSQNINEKSGNPVLYQNVPNPFNKETSIQYFIPSAAKSAQIIIFDMSGKLLNTVPIKAFGNGTLIINGGELNPGMFIYSLVVDGNEIDAKRMILTK